MDFHGVNGWLDLSRVVIAALSFWCCYRLVCDNLKFSHTWNTKTKDAWYAVFMWSVAGVVLPIQGILLDRPLTAGYLIIFAATMVTGKFLHTKGPWGGDA